MFLAAACCFLYYGYKLYIALYRYKIPSEFKKIQAKKVCPSSPSTQHQLLPIITTAKLAAPSIIVVIHNRICLTPVITVQVGVVAVSCTLSFLVKTALLLFDSIENLASGDHDETKRINLPVVTILLYYFVLEFLPTFLMLMLLFPKRMPNYHPIQ